MGGYIGILDGLLLIWTMDFIPKSVSWTCYGFCVFWMLVGGLSGFGLGLTKKLNITNILQYNKTLITILLQNNHINITHTKQNRNNTVIRLQ